MDLFADKRPNQDLNKNVNQVADVAALKRVHPWKVLLVDDDEQMHQITKLALKNFSFQQRPLKLISAYSSEEAKAIIFREQDIALALIDVVMEKEHSGLELVRYIREELNNSIIRLVLRTGQAGQAPEDKVIQEYEIDDYKEKTELTTQKLRTLLYSMLRSYRDLCLIRDQKEGLSRVIEASAKVQNTRTLQTYASTVLEQLTSLLSLQASAFYCLVQPREEGEESYALTLAATGDYVSLNKECRLHYFPQQVAVRCQEVLRKRESKDFGDAYVFFMSEDRGVDNLLYVNLTAQLSELDKQLLIIYMHNIALTFDNINLLVDLQETSKELVFNLSNAVEAKSRETGAHVQRVSLYCEKLARLYGLPEYDVRMIQNASPLHDIGKVAIPDSILHKPGKLDTLEWEIMQRHVDFGVDILDKSKRKLMQLAKVIASTHHEKWDGTGYPNQLAGGDIPISGRIVAIADVFDALGSKRSYKEAWNDIHIKRELLNQSGKHFDPVLIDLFIANWDDFIAIRDAYPDD